MKDLQGNELNMGSRVAAIDSIDKVSLRMGTIVGYTPKRVKILFDNEVKASAKAPHVIIKTFIQDGELPTNRSKECKLAFCGTHGTECAGFNKSHSLDKIHSCPANYHKIYNPKNCPEYCK